MTGTQHDRRGGGDQLVYGELADGDEKPLAVSEFGRLFIRDSISYDLLREILAELRAINVHLLAITDERVSRE